MPSDFSDTSTYTGPLKAFVSDELGDGVGLAYLHRARQKLGDALSYAGLADQENICRWFYYPDSKITLRVGRLGGVHFAEVMPLVSRPLSEAASVPTIWPWGGLLRDSFLDKVEEVTGSGTVTLPINDAFIPTNESLLKLDSRYESITKWLIEAYGRPVQDRPPEKELVMATLIKGQTHHKQRTGLIPTPILALPVPEKWGHLYNNPVQPNFETLVDPKVFAQHRLIKPTMYSGRMRIVAQVLMGFGTQVELTPEEMDALQTQYGVPEYQKVIEDYERHPSEKELGLLNYWFHWYKTHGIYKTKGERYYLIEISEDGVYAMRLPVLPKENGVPDEVAEYLPALPLGFNFPTREITPEQAAAGVTKTAFDKALADGWVFEVISRNDMAPFYERLSPTYAECGWSFSMTGNKIDNVGHYPAAPRPHDYPVFEQWHIELEGGDGPSSTVWDYQHFDGGHDESINTLRGSLKMVRKGSAVNVAVYAQAFKVPTVDPLTGVPGVVSFSMLPREWPADGRVPPDYMAAWPSYPICDTVIHVFYDDDELVWIKYYNAGAHRKEITTNNGTMPGEIELLLGSNSWGSSSSFSHPPPGFYSNRIDPRNTEGSSSLIAVSQGRKIWESPYMGIEYSWPYPPMHFGYEQSNSETEWFNEFNPSYRSVAGRPWTAKRHAYHVTIKGSGYTGQSYAYGCAIPLTDREAAFICELNKKATSRVIDYQYAAMIMQFVYATYPSWVPDPAIWDKGIVPVGAWEDWQLRDDTVKYLQWMYLPQEEGTSVTNEPRMAPRTVLNVQSGTYTAPVVTWNNGTSKTDEATYKVVTICSSLGGEYPMPMLGTAGADQLWINTLPDPNPSGFKIAHLWCTRSVIGRPGFKQNIQLNGSMNYSGVFGERLSADEKTGRFRQITFVGVT